MCYLLQGHGYQGSHTNSCPHHIAPTVLHTSAVGNITSLHMPIPSQEFQMALGHGANRRVSQGEWAIATRTGKGLNSKL